MIIRESRNLKLLPRLDRTNAAVQESERSIPFGGNKLTCSGLALSSLSVGYSQRHRSSVKQVTRSALNLVRDLQASEPVKVRG